MKVIRLQQVMEMTGLGRSTILQIYFRGVVPEADPPGWAQCGMAGK